MPPPEKGIAGPTVKRTTNPATTRGPTVTTTYWKIHSSVETNFPPEERKAKVYANGSRYFLNKAAGEKNTAELNQGRAHKAAGLDQPEGLQGTYALHSRTISKEGVYQDGDEAAAELTPPVAPEPIKFEDPIPKADQVFAQEPEPSVQEFVAKNEPASESPVSEPVGSN